MCYNGAMSRKRMTGLVAVVLAVAAAIVLSTVPVYSGEQSSTSSTGAPVVMHTSQTVLQVMGGGYLVILLLPAIVLAIPLLLRGRAASVGALAAAVLVGMFVVLGILSIGLFYLPAAVCAVVAAALPSPPKHPSAAP